MIKLNIQRADNCRRIIALDSQDKPSACLGKEALPREESWGVAQRAIKPRLNESKRVATFLLLCCTSAV
jgi:hypothetical protein